MTKHSVINWRVLWILLGASIFCAIAVIPFQFTLQGILLSEVPLLNIIISIIINGVLFFVVIFVGLFLSKKIGFGAPVLERLTEKKEVITDIKSILGISIGLGFFAGILIIIGDYLLYIFGETTITLTTNPAPVWQGFLAAFYGGINEEILMRLFFMSLLIWIFFKIKKTDDGKPTHLSVWFAIIVAAILFGIGHLLITSSLTAITSVIIARAILLNGIGGVIFGWLYWRKGLESAMISHFCCDIMLYVIFPLIPL